jgi:hypothetical protein
MSIFPKSKGRLPQEEHDRRISQIAGWIVEGLPRRQIIQKIRETFKIGKSAPKWIKLAFSELAKDMPDVADLRTEAVEKSRELYRRAYAEGNLGEANKALAMLARLTGIEEIPDDKAREVVVRFANAADPAPAPKPEA